MAACTYYYLHKFFFSMTYFPMSVHLSHLLVLHYDFFDQHKLDILGYPSANNKNDHQELLNKYEDNFAVELV